MVLGMALGKGCGFRKCELGPAVNKVRGGGGGLGVDLNAHNNM